MDKLLIISYFANIDALAPSHHIDDKLAYLRERSDVILLSSPCGKRNNNFVHKRVPSPAPSGLRYELRFLLRRRCRTKFWRKTWELFIFFPVLPFYLLEKIILKLDSTWSWFLTASVAATVLALKHRPRAIYSTGGPVSAHIAAMLASRISGIPFIAEFQDPLTHQYGEPRKFERFFIKDIERLIFKSASKGIFLTSKAADEGARRHGTGNALHIYAGGLPFPKRTAAHKQGTALRLSHFGSLGGSRNLDCLLEAIEELMEKRQDIKDRIALELYGSIGSNVAKRIEQSSCKGIVQEKGSISRENSIGLMASTDVLLLIQNTDSVSSETIPSKTYEYLNAKRPILGLVYRNPELKAMLEKYGHIVCDADDSKAIKAALMEYIALWEKGALETSQKDSPYTVEASVQEFFALFSPACAYRSKKKGLIAENR